MRFVMYTEKTVAQAMRSINDRLHLAPTKTRPQLDGWVEKSGRFALGVTSTVRWHFRRKTYLRGQASREDGVTVVRGTVPGGATGRSQITIFVALALVGLLLLTQGQALMALIAVAAGAALYIPLQGDYDNSEILLAELQKALHARFTPPGKKKK